VLLARGGRSFAPPLRSTPQLPGGITPGTVADVDGDGVADVVTDGGDSSGGDYVAYLHGRGDGTFAPPRVLLHRSFSALLDIVDLSVADLNHDAIPDLVFGTERRPEVMLGRGGGTFAKPAAIATSEIDAQLLAVGDVDGDGSPDLVQRGVHGLAVLHGRGDGTFGPPQAHGTAGDLAAIGDLDGDGRPDLALVDSGYDDVFTLESHGDATLSPPPTRAENVYLASARSGHRWRELRRAAPVERRSLRFRGHRLVWTTRK
jgi:hypothetical protein